MGLIQGQKEHRVGISMGLSNIFQIINVFCTACLLSLLQGNLQIDGSKTSWDGLGALGLGQKIIEIMKDTDLFKDTQVYDYGV